MAVVFMTGFESVAQKVDDITPMNVSYTTTHPRTGAYEIRCNPASGATAYVYTATGNNGYWVHFGLYIAAMPSGADRTIAGTAKSGFSIVLTTTGYVEVWYSDGLLGTSATALSTGKWYWVGINTNAVTAQPIVQVDGQDFVSGTKGGYGIQNFGASVADAATLDIYIDDIICDNAGFLAPSRVALLLPISDNARATLWTGGAGGTTSLYDAVNNCPPIGTATETNLTQIEHAGGGGGGDAYNANMTTYATAGVGTSDTIIALQGLIVWGEDAATGTKLLSYGGFNNPDWTGEASIDVSTGHGSGAVGTYGTGTDYWNERRSAIKTTGLVIGTDITLDNSPMMSVWRPETASRVASVCFMGMLVAWTPYVAPPSIPPKLNIYPQILAQ